MRMVTVGIIGASGFTGAELLRLRAQHPDFEVVYATGDSQAGSPAAALYPALAAAYPDLVFEEFDLDGPMGSMLSSSACRTRPAWRWRRSSSAGRLRGRPVGRVPAEGRFAVPEWYGFEHDQPELLAEAVFGLPELYRAELKGAGADRHARLPRHRRDAGVRPAGRRPA